MKDEKDLKLILNSTNIEDLILKYKKFLKKRLRKDIYIVTSIKSKFFDIYNIYFTDKINTNLIKMNGYTNKVYLGNKVIKDSLILSYFFEDKFNKSDIKVYFLGGKLSGKEKNIITDSLNIFLGKLYGYIENIFYKNKIKARERSILTINEFSDLLNLLSGADESAIQSMYLGFSAESIDADRVTFYYYDENRKQLYPNFIMVYKKHKLLAYDYYSELKDISLKVGEDLSGITAKLKEPILIEDIKKDKNKFYLGKVDKKIGMKIKSIISLPVIIKDKIFGIIEVASVEKKFTKIELSVLKILTNLVVNIMERTTLYNWAITDNLTQLYNFHYLQLALEQELTRIKRYPQPLSLIMIDIDNFKRINDTYGHQFGNVVLKTLSRIIRESLRKNIDLPARYGGDEFMIILPHTNLKGATVFAERILNKIREVRVKYNNKPISFTVSIGVSSITDRNITKDKFIEMVDSALYKSKNRGKNQIQIYEEL